MERTLSRSRSFFRQEDCPPVEMAVCLQKAVSLQETAVKEKHIRSAIIGTFQERGATTFWDCVLRIPLRENPIVCWKFCHVLHKVLREGHDHVLRDSQRFRPMLLDHGKFWSHLRTGYGSLIKLYCHLLVTKLTFHQRNNRIKGNLELTDAELQQCLGDEADVPFQLSVEILDYLDCILELQSEIFKTMDPRCNSMTNAGQCRLKPLISCIQEAMLLYDYVTKILFQLHTQLPPDVLSGHRKRFATIFDGLKQFFEKTMSLQYFKSLIEIQQLPKYPPNFLEYSDLQNYQTRRVTIKDDPPERDTLDTSSDTMSELVDLAESNGSTSPDPSYMTLILEKEKMNEHLRAEIDRLKSDIGKLQMEATTQIRQLQFENQELKTDHSETVRAFEETKKKLDEHECKGPAEQAERLDRAEKHIKVVEEKFGKIKDVYAGLREEHIDLLRKKAAVDKELTDLKKAAECQSEMALLLEKLKQEHEDRETELTEQLNAEIAAVKSKDVALTQLKTQLDNTIADHADFTSSTNELLLSKEHECLNLHEAVTLLKSELESLKKANQETEMRLSSQLSEKSSQNKALEEVIDDLKAKLTDSHAERTAVELHFQELLALKAQECENLHDNCTKLELEIQAAQAANTKAAQAHDEELKRKDAAILRLEGETSELHKSLAALQADLKASKDKNERTQEVLEKAEESNSRLRDNITSLEAKLVDDQKRLEEDALVRYNELLDTSLQSSENVIKKTIEDMENPILIGGTGTLDHFLLLLSSALRDSIPKMERLTTAGFQSYSSLKSIVDNTPHFTFMNVTLLLHGSATSRTSADIQKGDEMLSQSKEFGNAVLDLMVALRQRQTHEKTAAAYDAVYTKLKSLQECAKNMGSSLPSEADAAEALDKELQAMEQAIEEAAKKMEEILSNSRASHTGVKLEVNEKLIDSCTGLMNSIRLLVQRAKVLQSEIAAQGKGSTSVKEFYKRNHQWTEGLISAAKAVGIGAKFLLESADKAVSTQQGSFEFLIASSQEIAASTIQLVVASQVRADRSSKNLSMLKQASTGVKTATAHVVATAKDCAQLIEESDEVDVTKLSPHYAKRMELETQAEVLRLETDLEKCRMKLASLRQHHYHNSDG